MRQPFFLSWPSADGSLHFGGGAAAPPAPPVPMAPMQADTQGAKDRSNRDVKRRIGGADAMKGGILGSLAKQKTIGTTSTLGGSAPAYTGEA